MQKIDYAAREREKLISSAVGRLQKIKTLRIRRQRNGDTPNTPITKEIICEKLMRYNGVSHNSHFPPLSFLNIVDKSISQTNRFTRANQSI